MAKLSKNRKDAFSKVDSDSTYSTLEAAKLVKETSTEKFDASVDIAVKLGVDPKQANQMVRGVVALPHGTGKSLKVLALVSADKEAEAKESGADYVGLDDYIEKIMSAVMSKHTEKNTIAAIHEYFQNHTTKFEFKI